MKHSKAYSMITKTQIILGGQRTSEVIQKKSYGVNETLEILKLRPLNPRFNSVLGETQRRKGVNRAPPSAAPSPS